MKDIVQALREHLANTPQEELDREWEELKEWGEIGPTVDEYLEWVKEIHPEWKDELEKKREV